MFCTIHKGDKSETVEALQKAMHLQNVTNTLPITGVYDDATVSVVADWKDTHDDFVGESPNDFTVINWVYLFLRPNP